MPGAGGHADSPPPPGGQPVPETGLLPKGHVIGGRYRVDGVIGVGGFGIVYGVEEMETGRYRALKTFRDRYLTDLASRREFRQEAATWIALDRHPNIVAAISVADLEGRLYIALECVSTGPEGLNSLAGYIKRKPPNLARTLRWAIQCCDGMEHAYSKGLRAHRDLKPSNILIDTDGTAKITDFGLSSAIEQVGAGAAWYEGAAARIGLAAADVRGVYAGTPLYMAPEQFSMRNQCDERSDLYSFGVILFEMASRGLLPFEPPRPSNHSPEAWEAYMQEIRRLHEKAPIPRIDSPLEPILRSLLEKDPVGRIQTFAELRGELEALLYRTTGEASEPARAQALGVADWVNKGISLRALGRHKEAIECYDNALVLDPFCTQAWLDKGVAFGAIGRSDDAIACFRRALELNPNDELAWDNLSRRLVAVGRPREAFEASERSLQLEQSARAWSTRGLVHAALTQHKEALAAFDQSLRMDANSTATWKCHGSSLAKLGHHKEATLSYEKALAIDPLYVDAWIALGRSKAALHDTKESLTCFDKALKLEPHNSEAWYFRGARLMELERFEEALASFEKSIAANSKDHRAWEAKGAALLKFGLNREAAAALGRALALCPASQEPRRAALAAKQEQAQRLAAQGH